MVAAKDIYQLLLDKIPTFRALEQISTNECGETMQKLVSSYVLHVKNLDEKMYEYTGEDVFVRESLKEKIEKAASYISAVYPDVMLQVHYGYRHPEIQSKRYEYYFDKIKHDSSVLDKDQHVHTFIAHPSVAGHPTGGAVDVTLVNKETKEPLDMGTDLREFSEHTLTFCPFISKQAWHNRRILRTVMIKYGFAPYDGEWWHFSYGDKEWAYFYNQPNALYEKIYFTKKGKSENAT